MPGRNGGFGFSMYPYGRTSPTARYVLPTVTENDGRQSNQADGRTCRRPRNSTTRPCGSETPHSLYVAQKANR
jgi:hypothetical protein